MASTPTTGHPGRLLIAFTALIGVLYALVFFTGDGKPEPKLGIDLQGGTRVTLSARTPDGSSPSRDSLRQAQSIIDSRVNGLGVAGSEVVIDGDNIVITVPGEDGSQARTLGQTARLYIRPVDQAAAPNADRQGKTPAPEQPTGTQVAGVDSEAAAKEISDARATRQSTDPIVQQQAMNDIDCAAPDPLRGNDDPELPLVACDSTSAAVYLLQPSIIDGQNITDAKSGYDGQQARNVVSLSFNSSAGNTWAEFTANNIGKQAAFVLDSQVVSAPVIQGATPAGSQTQITGQFTAQQASDLANTLKYGSLPLSFASSEAETVSATLGLASLQAGLLAGAIGLGMVLIYCFVYYRLLGLLTMWSLVCSGFAVYAIMVLLGRWINFTLDLAGVAGLIIGIGMTADSFVVFFERIKDEIREGRTFRSAVPRGWARARKTILSGNAVSFIAAAVLYVLAIGQVRGFAFTLGLTTVLDVVVVFLVTAPLLLILSRTKFWARDGVNGLGAIEEVARERRAGAHLSETASTATESQR